ncbi:hypothetical protein [Kordiimonas sp. SCSIO 12610]|uniref:hypothetical protein n=1 Tax=Kordiimonas sp. SCSIO 12610 TaxID=2829597 RepID=UPI00210DB9EF|nr:hypothetical protein [Kordiimonas sp. SCSIO 12610]UTW56719.1 hypothetical protein KFF44_07480 [Kordiimonas sp. SCSIO 12610]
MRKLIWGVFVIVCMMWLVTYCSTSVYFPNSYYSRKDGSSLAKEYFAQALDRMNEPSLYQTALNTSSSVYRLLWLPSHDDAVVIRIKVSKQNVTIRSKVLEWDGDKSSNSIIKANILKDISAKDMSELALKLEQSDWLRGLGRPNNSLEFDGSYWVFEIVDNNKYRVIDRWSISSKSNKFDEQLYEIGKDFIELSGLDFEHVY